MASRLLGSLTRALCARSNGWRPRLLFASPFGAAAPDTLLRLLLLLPGPTDRPGTNTTFRTGIGIAYNNCTDFDNHLVLGVQDKVRVHIVRGPAELTTDNTPEIVVVESKDDILIKRSGRSAKVFAVDNLRCSLCRYKHAPRRRF